MSRIPPEELDSIRTKIAIEDVIGEHVALKAAGSSLKGLCPFHQEKTPSFNVNRTSNTFHCFGCGESGDVIEFIRRIEGEGFRWAVLYLAEQHNIPITFTEDDEGGKTKKSRLIEANAVAANAFSYALRKSAEAQPARDLLLARGFDVDDAANRFGCGYAPQEQSLSKLLLSKDFTKEEIVEAGLAYIDRQGQPADRFRGRLTWSIRNSFGKPIGFGARKLRDDDPLPGKFINTSETPVYKKSSVLYGLDVARKEIARTRQAIVVEGYTDVMALHLAGSSNTIAACGTAFTLEHFHLLRRLVGPNGEIVFAFDDDSAGQKAAQSAYREFNKAQRRLSALPRTDGLDPDEVRQHHGDQALAELVTHRIPLSEAIITMVVNQMPTDTPEDRITALDAAIPYLNDISDTLVRHEYAVKVAMLLRFNPNQVEARLSASEPEPAPDPGDAAPARKLPPEWVEKELLQVLAQNHELAEEYLSDWDIDQKFSKAASDTALDVLRRGLAEPNEDRLVWPMLLKKVCTSELETKILTPLIATDLPVTAEKVDEYAAEMLTRLGQQEQKRSMGELKEKIGLASTPEEKRAALNELIAFQKRSVRN